ncbi:sugar kinase [Paenibacillus gansuensis]|uniref:Sugar kinase n=1 Tax=Paenibacillus gansuensis TaxID=306542 RepID=A0ABW5PC03_9BACL
MLRTKKWDVITFGETMGLLYPEDSGGLQQRARLTQTFGGAESNVAIALARMGCSAGWFSRVGEDPIGTSIVKTVRGEGVDVSRVISTSEASTGLMLRENVRGRLSVFYYRRGSAASLLSPAHVDKQYIADARLLHVTGITPALSGSCADAVEAAMTAAVEAGTRISFDPNIRLKLWSADEARPVLLKLAGMADYFLPGYDELKLLYQTEDEAELLRQLRALPGITVVKSWDGHNVLVTPEDIVRIPFERVEHMIDPIGAGDAFTGGFLAGLSKGYNLQEAVRIGGIAGALTVQQQGDWEALPTWDEVDRYLTGRGHIER